MREPDDGSLRSAIPSALPGVQPGRGLLTLQEALDSCVFGLSGEPVDSGWDDPSAVGLRNAQAFLTATLLAEKAGAAVGELVVQEVDRWCGVLLAPRAADRLWSRPRVARTPWGRCLALCAALRDPMARSAAVREWLECTDSRAWAASSRSVFSDVEVAWLRSQLSGEARGSSVSGMCQHPFFMAGTDFDYMTHTVWYASDFGVRPLADTDGAIADAVAMAALWQWHHPARRAEALLAVACLGRAAPAWLGCAARTVLADAGRAHAAGWPDVHWYCQLSLLLVGLVSSGVLAPCRHEQGHIPMESLSSAASQLVQAARTADFASVNPHADAFREVFGETPTWHLATELARRHERLIAENGTDFHG